MRTTHSVDSEGRRSRSGSSARLGNDRDDPALNLHNRMNQPHDERPLYGQGRLFAAMLVIAAAYRNFWISRFEGWHVYQVAGTRNGSGTLGHVAVVERNEATEFTVAKRSADTPQKASERARSKTRCAFGQAATGQVCSATKACRLPVAQWRVRARQRAEIVNRAMPTSLLSAGILRPTPIWSTSCAADCLPHLLALA